MEFNANNAPASGEDANGRPANSGANPAGSNANSGPMPPPDQIRHQPQPRGGRRRNNEDRRPQSNGARRWAPKEPCLSANFEDGVEIPPSQQEIDAHAQAMASYRDAAARAQEESFQPRKKIRGRRKSGNNNQGNYQLTDQNLTGNAHPTYQQHRLARENFSQPGSNTDPRGLSSGLRGLSSGPRGQSNDPRGRSSGPRGVSSNPGGPSGADPVGLPDGLRGPSSDPRGHNKRNNNARYNPSNSNLESQASQINRLDRERRAQETTPQRQEEISNILRQITIGDNDANGADANGAEAMQDDEPAAKKVFYARALKPGEYEVMSLYRGLTEKLALTEELYNEILKAVNEKIMMMSLENESVVLLKWLWVNWNSKDYKGEVCVGGEPQAVALKGLINGLQLAGQPDFHLWRKAEDEESTLCTISMHGGVCTASRRPSS
jgi:hypothetical protein